VPKKEKLNGKTKDGLKPLSSSLANLPGSTNQSHQKPDLSKRVEPWITPRDIGDDKKRRPVIPKGDNRNSTLKSKVRKDVLKVSGPDAAVTNQLPAQAFRAKVDISGFDNDEISLELEGRKLVITANRAKKGTQNARKLTEVIEIPEGVNLENLKMGRRLDGSLLIEEFVPGLD
jgi:HSP20 family molecular chaperone IbpA